MYVVCNVCVCVSVCELTLEIKSDIGLVTRGTVCGARTQPNNLTDDAGGTEDLRIGVCRFFGERTCLK